MLVLEKKSFYHGTTNFDQFQNDILLCHVNIRCRHFIAIAFQCYFSLYALVYMKHPLKSGKCGPTVELLKFQCLSEIV